MSTVKAGILATNIREAICRAKQAVNRNIKESVLTINVIGRGQEAHGTTPHPLWVTAFCCLSLLLLSLGTACAQRNLKEVAKDELTIKFEHVAKLGETKKYLITLDQTPTATALPQSYRLFQNNVYYVKSGTIDLGYPIVTFKVPAIKFADFGKLRLLHLVPNELVPKGSEWKDCTIAVDNVWEPRRYFAPELAAYLPNYPQKTISCELSGGHHPEEFFAMVSQDLPAPTSAFTSLVYEIEGSERRPLRGDVSYDLTLKNIGQKNIGELNILSSFGSALTSWKAERGKCQRSNFGYGGGSLVCFLGELPVNGTVKIHFNVTVIPQLVEPPNVFSWNVYAIMKEKPEEPVWPVNMINLNLLPEK